MSDHAQSASALLPVSFQDTTLYLTEHQGEPFAPMKPIIDGIGLAWQSQLQKLNRNKDRWGVTIIVIPSDSGPQQTVCMPVRKLPAFFSTIHPNKVRAELRERIRAYQAECDDVLWNYWSRQRPGDSSQEALPGPPTGPDTKEVRTAINRVAHSMMLLHYDRVRENLQDAVRRHHEKYPDADLVRYVQFANTPTSAMVCVHEEDLFFITASLMQMQKMFQEAVQRVHALEETTGREWYNRRH